MTKPLHHVFLVPGFLGIETLGDVVYFAHVRDRLVVEFRALGLEVEIHAVRNYPTSSVRKRAARLLETILRHAPDGDSPVHLIGHSTGGLDARLLCTPGVRLGDDLDAQAVAARVRSIVTVSCPHRGTPLATFFTTRFGAQLLSVLSLGTTYLLRFGRLPISAVVRMAALFVRVHSRLGVLENTIASHLFEHLLGDFSAERRDEMNELFEALMVTLVGTRTGQGNRIVVVDRALLGALAPPPFELLRVIQRNHSVLYVRTPDVVLSEHRRPDLTKLNPARPRKYPEYGVATGAKFFVVRACEARV